MSVPPFLFIRHGETDWNSEGRLQGTRDVSLNARGVRQAREAGRRTAAYFAFHRRAPEAFVCSPLARTRQTMAGVRGELGLDPETYAVDDRLREFSFGAWEGLTWAEVKARDPIRQKARRLDKWTFVPPGGESYAMLAERLRPWLDTVEEWLVVVSHGGVARALMVLAGGASPHAVPAIEVPQGRVLRFAHRGYSWL